LLHINFFRALLSQALPDKLIHVICHLIHESGIADVSQVGVGELFGFNHDVQRSGRIRPVVTQGIILHNVEHLKRRHTLSIRRQLVHRPSSVAAAHWLYPLRFKLLEVREGVPAALLSQKRYQALGDRSRSSAIKRGASARSYLKDGKKEGRQTMKKVRAGCCSGEAPSAALQPNQDF
jgi:hypothetical protein